MDDERYGTNDQYNDRKSSNWNSLQFTNTFHLLVMFCYVTTSPRRGIQARPTLLTHIAGQSHVLPISPNSSCLGTTFTVDRKSSDCRAVFIFLFFVGKNKGSVLHVVLFACSYDREPAARWRAHARGFAQVKK
jgi:hypothetical protein